MPLFFNKFNPKKTPPRKAPLSTIHSGLNAKRAQEELGTDISNIKLKLGDIESVFEDGEWICDTSNASASSNKTIVKLKQRAQNSEEENNLLKIKIEVLLDMMTELADESMRLRKEIDALRRFMNDSKTTKRKVKSS